MQRDYIPAPEAELLAWSVNFLSIISAQHTALGLSQEQVDSFAAAQADYAAKQQAAFDPSTRTTPAVAARNEARGAMIALARQLVRIIQACPAVTDAQRFDLKITVRKSPMRTPAPATRPRVGVMSVERRTVTVRLRDTESSSRGKPDGAAGAKVYTFIGPEYPSDPAMWTYHGDTTKTNFEIAFPFTLSAGTQVWVSAAWYNRRGETGPLSEAVTTNLQGGGASTPAMKIAA